METSESRLLNRGNNLALIVFLAAIGLGILVEVFMEKEWADKIDDIIIVLLALIGLVWYMYGQNRFKRAFAPVLLVILAFIVKIGAFIVEFDDKEAIGDEFGVILPLLLLVIVGIVLYASFRQRRERESNKRIEIIREPERLARTTGRTKQTARKTRRRAKRR